MVYLGVNDSDINCGQSTRCEKVSREEPVVRCCALGFHRGWMEQVLSAYRTLLLGDRRAQWPVSGLRSHSNEPVFIISSLLNPTQSFIPIVSVGYTCQTRQKMSGSGNGVMLVFGVAVLLAVSAMTGNACLWSMWISCGCQLMCCPVIAPGILMMMMMMMVCCRLKPASFSVKIFFL